MLENKEVVALIPARGGSKGLPRKNILEMAGKPLIAWSIIQAKQSDIIDRVVVSTDDKEITEIADSFGAEIPFVRPKELATDEAKGLDVILHALRWFKEHGQTADIITVLQPTSPLRLPADIDNSLDFFLEREADAVVSVCKTEHHPYWSNVLPEDKCMKDFIRNDVDKKNREELPEYYRLNGAIFIAKADFMIQNESYYGDNTYAYVMPEDRSIDIDSHLDFRLAGLLMENRIHG